MKALFILWTCDAWHTHSSKRFAGVFETHELAQKNAKNDTKKSSEGKLSKDDEFHLSNLPGGISQTQGRSENYIIEEVELNKLV